MWRSRFKANNKVTSHWFWNPPLIFSSINSKVWTCQRVRPCYCFILIFLLAYDVTIRLQEQVMAIMWEDWAQSKANHCLFRRRRQASDHERWQPVGLFSFPVKRSVGNHNTWQCFSLICTGLGGNYPLCTTSIVFLF